MAISGRWIWTVWTPLESTATVMVMAGETPLLDCGAVSGDETGDGAVSVGCSGENGAGAVPAAAAAAAAITVVVVDVDVGGCRRGGGGGGGGAGAAGGGTGADAVSSAGLGDGILSKRPPAGVDDSAVAVVLSDADDALADDGRLWLRPAAVFVVDGADDDDATGADSSAASCAAGFLAPPPPPPLDAGVGSVGAGPGSGGSGGCCRHSAACLSPKKNKRNTGSVLVISNDPIHNVI